MAILIGKTLFEKEVERLDLESHIYLDDKESDIDPIESALLFEKMKEELE